jgi:hypothetical protein
LRKGYDDNAYSFVLSVAVSFVAPAAAQGSLTPLNEARASYGDMMETYGCEMTAQEISSAMAAAFAIFNDGLIEQTGFNQVQYTGPDCWCPPPLALRYVNQIPNRGLTMDGDVLTLFA